MAKDIYHETVKTALIKDGWMITDDPLRLKVGGRMAYVDLGAQKLFAAEKEGRKIAVEVKSFLNPSPVQDLEQALGQYIMYSQVLSKLEPKRLLYLGIPQSVFFDFFSEELPQLIIELNHLKLLVFDPEAKEVVQWIA
ncbi:element excision factor XisH family protein [Coleofasciculus sp.]|uniref:element excision factor XisH family protein n=1 Tax=Coleofasciculus sp. TaxID=3100458 RepID=UPI003A14BAF3